MRVVNLSHRPFLNRRPVARIALLLWLIGGLLLAFNLWLYAGYLSGTTKNRERLAELGSEIDAAEQKVDEVRTRLLQIDLGGRNARAAFLNELIDQRTFPWSRLFDDLEDALHEDIYLVSVAPRVTTDDAPRSQARSQARPTPSRLTPRQAREQARRQRQGGLRGGQEMPSAESINVEESDEVELVELALRGTARSDDALLDFVDAMYQNEQFAHPFLASETRDERTRGVDFVITSYYLLPRRRSAAEGVTDTVDPSVADGAVAEAVVEPGVEPGAEAGVETGAGTRSRADRADDPSAAGDGSGMAASTRSDPPFGGDPRATPPDGTPPDGTPPDGAPDVRRPARDDANRGERTVPASAKPLVPTGAEEPLDGVNDSPPTEPTPSSPHLTEPAASASPALRRLGRLAPEFELESGVGHATREARA